MHLSIKGDLVLLIKPPSHPTPLQVPHHARNDFFVSNATDEVLISIDQKRRLIFIASELGMSSSVLLLHWSGTNQFGRHFCTFGLFISYLSI